MYSREHKSTPHSQVNSTLTQPLVSMKGGQVLFLFTKSHNFGSSFYYKLTYKIFIYARRYEINKKKSLTQA